MGQPISEFSISRGTSAWTRASLDNVLGNRGAPEVVLYMSCVLSVMHVEGVCYVVPSGLGPHGVGLRPHARMRDTL